MHKDKKHLPEYVELGKETPFAAMVEGYCKPTYACKAITPEKMAFATL